MTEVSTPHDGQHTLESYGDNEIYLSNDTNHGVTPAMVVARHGVDAEDRKLLVSHVHVVIRISIG